MLSSICFRNGRVEQRLVYPVQDWPLRSACFFAAGNTRVVSGLVPVRCFFKSVLLREGVLAASDASSHRMCTAFWRRDLIELSELVSRRCFCPSTAVAGHCI